MSYIILKRVIWRFQICNLFREKLKFRGFTKAFKNFVKYIIAFIFAKINVVSAAIYIMSEMPFSSCNFDMRISHTRIFLSESVVYKITNYRF